MASDEPIKLVQITVRLEEHLHTRLKLVQLREGKSIQFLFSDYVKRYVEAKEKAHDAKS